jgi:hypothetical protein
MSTRRFWKLVAVGAVFEAAWLVAMVVVPSGLVHGLVQVLGFPVLCAVLIVAESVLP